MVQMIERVELHIEDEHIDGAARAIDCEKRHSGWARCVCQGVEEQGVGQLVLADRRETWTTAAMAPVFPSKSLAR
jgi:hypothetical protein